MRIADNKTSEYAEWDEELLKIELEQLEDMNFNLDDLNRFDNDAVVSPEILKEMGLVKKGLDGIKVLGNGTLEKKYKIGHGTIANWIRIYLEDGEDALTPHNGNPYAALHTSKNLSEVDRLRLIIAKQEVEIARLKKGYYVEGVGADKVFVTGKDSNTK